MANPVAAILVCIRYYCGISNLPPLPNATRSNQNKIHTWTGLDNRSKTITKAKLAKTVLNFLNLKLTDVLSVFLERVRAPELK